MLDLRKIGSLVILTTISFGAVADIRPDSKGNNKANEAITSVAGVTSLSLLGLGKLYQSQRIQDMARFTEGDVRSLGENALSGDKVVIIHELAIHNLQKLIDDMEFERSTLIRLIESDKKQRRYFAVEIQLEESEYIKKAFSKQLERLDDSIERYTNRLSELDLVLKDARSKMLSNMRVVKEFDFHASLQKNIRKYLGNMEKEGYQIHSISRLPIKQYKRLNRLLMKSRASFIGAAVGAIYFLEELAADYIADFLNDNSDFEIEINQGHI